VLPRSPSPQLSGAPMVPLARGRERGQHNVQPFCVVAATTGEGYPKASQFTCWCRLRAAIARVMVRVKPVLAMAETLQT